MERDVQVGAWPPIDYSSLTFYGDGNDGDVTIAGTTTLSRDMNYNTLTVSGTLKCNGYKFFVKKFLKVEVGGTIQNDGLSG